MAYKVLRSKECVTDLSLIFDHLLESYSALGESLEDAFGRAEARVLAIDENIGRLALAPEQGTLRPELGDGIRNVTKDSAIFYFKVDRDRLEIRVLAVFYGGQDHQRHMLTRLLSGNVTGGDQSK